MQTINHAAGARAPAVPTAGADVLNLVNRLERLPLGRYQNTVFLIIATAWLFDSIDLAALTFVLAPISDEFGLSKWSAGLLASASFAGMFVGASTAGLLADRIGRRAVFQWSMVVWGVASLLLATSWSFESLLAFRFLLGVGMGAEFPVAQSLLCELLPTERRGRYVALLEGFWPLGFICAGALAAALVPTLGWRSVFVVQGGLAAWALVIRRAVPESPRWYASRGRGDEAEVAVAAMEARAERDSGRALPPALPASLADETTGRSSLRELFAPRYRRRTAMAWTLWFCVLLGYYGITSWIAKLLADQGLSVAKSISFVLLMALWGIPGFLCAAFLVDRIGRKATLVGSVLLSAAAAFVYGHADSTAQLIAAGSFMQFFFFAMWSALYAYTPEIFPTRARATGCGTASGMGRIGAAIGPLVVPAIIARGGTDLVFTFAALAFCVAAAAVILLGPETRQRVLEEVSA